jgi:hypothetical protein
MTARSSMKLMILMAPGIQLRFVKPGKNQASGFSHIDLFTTYVVAADYGCMLGLKIDIIGSSKFRQCMMV